MFGEISKSGSTNCVTHESNWILIYLHFPGWAVRGWNSILNLLTVIHAILLEECQKWEGTERGMTAKIEKQGKGGGDTFSSHLCKSCWLDRRLQQCLQFIHIARNTQWGCTTWEISHRVYRNPVSLTATEEWKLLYRLDIKYSNFAWIKINISVNYGY